MEVYIRIADGEIDRTEDGPDSRVLFDYDAAGKLLGVEILAADGVRIDGVEYGSDVDQGDER